MATETRFPLFNPGTVVAMPDGEYSVESFDGLDDKDRQVYTLISESVKNVSGHPVNRFKATIVPTLKIAGVCK